MLGFYWLFGGLELEVRLTCSLDDRREIHKQNRFDEFVGQAKYYFIIQQLPEPERFVN